MKTSTPETDLRARLRKAAILVASLDKPLAQQLLSSLPAREAAAIQELADQLRDVHDDEQQAVVTDFHHELSTPTAHSLEAPPTKLDGVELDASLLARLDDEDNLSALHTPAAATSPWDFLSDVDTASLVRLLEAEQPQTIAVVLAKMDPSRAAELLSHLAPTMQIDVLARLGKLDPADDRAVDVVGSQLTEWIANHRDQQERMSAGRDLVERILQSTPERQRTALLARLGKRDATAISEPSLSAGSSATQPERTAGRLRTSQPLTRVATHGLELTTNRLAEAADPLSVLESLDDQALLRALQSADRQTVLLALAGAGEGLLKRIVRGLPRKRANQFRQQVRAVGPTRLSDMLAAQRELLRCAQA